MAPAIWNRFPLLEWDTGGYLARWYEGRLAASRSAVYGFFVTAGSSFDFWPVVIAQAAATLWVLWLTMRTHDLEPSPSEFLGRVVALSVLTTLPWIAGMLLTDVFAGLAVLGLHLLLFKLDRLSACERVGLVAFVAFATATHSATLAVAVALLAGGALVSSIRRDLAPAAGVVRAGAAVALSIAMVVAANYVLVRRLAWTPGGFGIAFARMLEDGLVKPYLDRHCPQAQLELCPHRDRLPATADDFLWGNEIFDQLGRFDGLGDEMERIVRGSVAEAPLAHLRAALVATGRQLVTVAGGEGVVTIIWHTYGMIEDLAPSAAPAMWAARQQHGGIDFTAMNAVQVPIALLALALLPVVVVLARCRRTGADLGRLAASVMLAVVVNAAVCGVLSGPHPRYGARLAWLAGLTVMLAAAGLRRRVGQPEAETIPPAAARAAAGLP